MGKVGSIRKLKLLPSLTPKPSISLLTTHGDRSFAWNYTLSPANWWVASPLFISLWDSGRDPYFRDGYPDSGLSLSPQAAKLPQILPSSCHLSTPRPTMNSVIYSIYSRLLSLDCKTFHTLTLNTQSSFSLPTTP